MVLQVFPPLSPFLLWPVCRPLPALPGSGGLGLPPALLLIPPCLHEQGPLGVGDRELGDGKKPQFDIMDRRFVGVQPLITRDAIYPTRNLEQRWQQVGAMWSLPALEPRIAQRPQGQ